MPSLARHPTPARTLTPTTDQSDPDHYDECPVNTPDHYDECPVNTGDGPTWDRRRSECDATTVEDEAYYAELRNMANPEEGGGTPIRWAPTTRQRGGLAVDDGGPPLVGVVGRGLRQADQGPDALEQRQAGGAEARDEWETLGHGSARV
jgi:hypothetical protein